MRKIIIILILTTLFSLSSQTKVLAVDSKIIAATGQSEALTANVNRAQMINSAATEALNSFSSKGGTTPKVVMFIQNIGDGGEVISTLRSKFGQSVPIVGVDTSWADYTPHTIKSIPENSDMKTFTIMLLGGDGFDIEIRKQAVATDGSDKDLMIQGGKTLAQNLPIDNSRKNLILLMGAMHVPNNASVIEGMQQTLGKPLPGNIRIVGWGSPNWAGNVYVNDTRSASQTVAALLIKGNFEWAFQGIAHGTNGWNTNNDPVSAIGGKIDQIKQELGGDPDATFFVIGHPGRDKFVAIKNMLQQKLGTTHPLIGQHAGSETGHDSTAADVVGEGAHFFVAGIRTTQINTVCGSDLDGDSFVDLTDYSLLSSNFFKTNPNPLKSDINKDGFVDLTDYSLMAQSYFKSC